MRKFVTTKEKKIKPYLDMSDAINIEYKEYTEVLASGMFWEWYPNLTGDWEKDRDEWTEIHKELTKIRRRFETGAFKEHRGQDKDGGNRKTVNT